MRLLLSGCTATLRRIEKHYRDVLGVLVTPSQWRNPAKVSAIGLPWGIDNEAFKNFDPVKFRRLLARSRDLPGCVFVAAPDVVANARVTLERFWEWRGELSETGHPLALVGQDGAEDSDIPWDLFHAWFVGGSTRWKLSQASADLIGEAKRRGKWVHMGRVNSFRRLLAAHAMGCDSVDGTGMSRWGDLHLEKFCKWTRGILAQPLLFGR